MTQQEIKFIDSIKNKIKIFGIDTTLKECLSHSKNRFFETTFNDGSKELVDEGVEYFICKKSSAYFVEKYCFVTLPGTGKLPARLYYFQTEILKQMNKYRKVVFTKTRQAGLSTINALYCFHDAIFNSSGWIVIISKDAKSSQDFLSKIKDNLDDLPKFINISVEINNVKNLIFSNGSKIECFARSPTAGRSTSPSIVCLDECAFYSSNRIIQGIVASVQSALSRTGGRLIAISTPNSSVPESEGYWYYQQVKQLEETGGISPDGMSKLFNIDWWMIKDFERIKPHKGYNDKLKEFEDKDYFNKNEVFLEARKFFLPIENNWKANDWMRHQHQTIGPVLFQQEVLRNFTIMGNSIFSSELMDKIKSKAKEPKTKDILGGRSFKDLWIWKEPEPKKRYILGSDVASGTSNDYSSIEVIDVETYEQVAEYVGKCTVQDLAINIRKIGTYYNLAYAVVESNSIGEAVFSNLYYCDDGYNNLFKQQKSSNGVNRYTGWITSSKSRQLITNNFIDFFYVDELFDTIKIYSERLIGQMQTWINTSRGADHLQGSHDDAIMAFAIGLFNRSKAVETNASFLIDEKGKMINYESSDNIRVEEEKGLNPISSNQYNKYEQYEERIQENYGVDVNAYRWIIG